MQQSLLHFISSLILNFDFKQFNFLASEMESSPPVKRTRSRRVSQVIISDDSCDEDEDVRTRKRKTLKKNSIGDLSYIESDDDFSPPR